MALPSLIKMDFPRKKKKKILVTSQIVFFLNRWSLRYTACPGKHWIREHVAINLISIHIVSISFPFFLFSSSKPAGSRHVRVFTFGFCNFLLPPVKFSQQRFLGTAQSHPLLAHPQRGRSDHCAFSSSCLGDGPWPRRQRGSSIAAMMCIFCTISNILLPCVC